MSVNLYAGDPRTGKSYQVVTEVILNAISKNRRVVTNIRGVNRELMADYLESTGIERDKIGQVVLVDNLQVSDVNFFPTEDQLNTTVQPGDLVCIDECWKFWEKDKKLPSYVKSFFREHGHLIDTKTSYNCDIVLITQLPRDLHADILGIIEYTYVTVKLKSVGLNNTFNIEIYEKIPKYRDKPLRILTQNYKKERFEWYKSHTHEGAKEQVIDSRVNVLKGKYFTVLLPILFLCSIPAVIYLKHQFDGSKQAEEKAQAESSKKEQNTPEPTKTTFNNTSSPYSSEWYVSGYVSTPQSRIFYISDNTNTRLVINPKDYTVQGRILLVKVDDKWITNFSRSGSSSFLSPKLKQ